MRLQAIQQTRYAMRNFRLLERCRELRKRQSEREYFGGRFCRTRGDAKTQSARPILGENPTSRSRPAQVRPRAAMARDGA